MSNKKQNQTTKKTKPLYFVIPEEAQTSMKVIAAEKKISMKQLLLQWIDHAGGTKYAKNE